MAPHNSRAAFIGLGAMGAPMAHRLAGSLGPRLAVYDLDESRREEIAGSSGASAAASLAELADSDIVFVMVVNGDQAESVLFGSEGLAAHLAAGTVVVTLSTIGPEYARSIAARLAERGIGWVDAPVSGGVERAARGDLLIMAGGDDDSFEKAVPLLAELGSSVVRASTAADGGQKLKAVNQLLCGVHIAVAAEALAFADALGLDQAAVLDTLGKGAAASFMLSDRGPRMLETDPPVKSAIALFDKDLALVLHEAELVGTRTPIAAAARELYAEGMSAGWSHRDDSQIIGLFRG